MKNMIPMSHYQELLAENLKMRQSIANAKQIIAHEKLSRILVAGEIETENFARLMKMRAEGETTVDQIATAIGYKPKFVRTLIKLYREASGQSARNKNWII